MSRQATRHFSAALLKAAQAEQGIGTEDLARRMGVSLRVVQKWRAGVTTPSGANLLALSVALERSPETFYVIHDAESVA